MNEDARVYSMMAEHDRAVPMIEQIDQIMDALLDHDLIVPITTSMQISLRIIIVHDLPAHKLWTGSKVSLKFLSIPGKEMWQKKGHKALPGPVLSQSALFRP